MKRSDLRRAVLTISALALACATPDQRRAAGDTVAVIARRDTIFMRPTASATVDPGRAITLPDLTSDSVGYSLTTFVGGGGMGELPELGIVDSLGRRTGFDPATRRSLEEIPGAGYYSDPALDDDSAPDRDSSAPADQPIDSRELVVFSAQQDERYVLEIAASDSGTYYVDVRLHAKRGRDSDIKPMHVFPLRAGQVRRFAIRIGAGTIALSELP